VITEEHQVICFALIGPICDWMNCPCLAKKTLYFPIIFFKASCVDIFTS
jgi:hypothetical protein